MDMNEYKSLREVDILGIYKKLSNIFSIKKVSDKNKEISEQAWSVIVCYVALRYKENVSIEAILDKLNVDNIINEAFLKTMNETLKPIDIRHLIKQYSESELKAFIMYPRTNLFTQRDTYTTPENISKLALKLLDLKEHDLLLDMGSGLGSFLIEAKSLYENIRSVGVDYDINNCIIARVKFKLLDFDIEMINDDIFKKEFLYSGTTTHANKIFTNYPLGDKFQNLLLEPKTHKHMEMLFYEVNKNDFPYLAEWAYIFSAVNLIKKNSNGIAVILGSNGIANNLSDGFIRKHLITEGFIKAVIALPGNLLSYSKAETTLMVLSEGNQSIRMVDATSLYTSGRRINELSDKNIEEIFNAYNNDSHVSISVDIDQIKKNDYNLHPKRYLSDTIIGDDFVTIADIIEDIQRGAPIRAKELADYTVDYKTDIRYLELNNINDGLIDNELNCLDKVNQKLIENYSVKNRQVIISKSYPFKVAVVNKNKNEEIIAGGNLYCLEVDESKIDPFYLAAYLESENGRQEIEKYATGSVIKTLSIKGLKAIKIPRQNDALEKQIIKTYKNINQDISEARETLKQSKQEKNILFK